VELYIHSPKTPSWRGSQLNSTGKTLPFTFNVIIVTPSKFYSNGNEKKMMLASSSSEIVNYVMRLLRSGLQQESGTLSFVRVVSFSCQVGEPRLWITSHTGCSNHAPRRTEILICKCNLSFLLHRTLLFHFCSYKIRGTQGCFNLPDITGSESETKT
jgi:hypothetical protein